MRAAALSVAALVVGLARASLAASPGADPSAAGRAHRIVDAQIRAACQTGLEGPMVSEVVAGNELATVYADLESGDERRVRAGLAVADEIAAAIEHAWARSCVLDPIPEDVGSALDRLYGKKTVDCQMLARVEEIGERFRRLPRWRPPQAGLPPPPSPPSRELSKRVLVCMMNSIKGQVAACFARYQVPGVAMVNVVVSREGAVRTAATSGRFAGTPTGDCVAAAVKTLTFPPSDGVSTPYPFVLGSAAAAGAAEQAARIVATNRPLYYERLVTDADLDGRGADELRLLRNTIFARAGQIFEDRALHAYFTRQPWYRPRTAPAKLSALDEKNLAGIKLWETRARGLEDLRALVPQIDAAASKPAGDACGVGTRNVLRGRSQQRQLIIDAGRLPWTQAPNYGDIGLDSLGTRMKAVRVDCGPDLDGDGDPEAVVTLTRPYDGPPGDGHADPESIDLIFLASRHGSKWRAVVPLGIDGSIPGIEGSTGTSVQFVTLVDGRPALAIRRTGGGGGDCDCDSESTSVATLEHGQLQARGTFETGRPCECQYAGGE
jgi:hypothetical protein